jgi:undecaprenyl-diphosphatase
MSGSSALRHRAERILARERATLLLALLIVGGLWGFIALADAVRENETGTFDANVLPHLRRAEDPAVPLGPAWLLPLARDLTALGSVPVLTLAVLLVMGLLALERRSAMLALVFAAGVGALLLTTFLKDLFHRPRPEIVPWLTAAQGPSFPSGHALGSAAVYVTMAALLARTSSRPAVKAYFLACGLVATLLIGASRVYLGVHYPTDVLGGWTIGICWAVLCWSAASLLQRRGRVEAPTPSGFRRSPDPGPHPRA